MDGGTIAAALGVMLLVGLAGQGISMAVGALDRWAERRKANRWRRFMK